MRKSTAKTLRKIANHGGVNEITRRVYRRLKKSYNKLNWLEKTEFMKNAKQMLEPVGA